MKPVFKKKEKKLKNKGSEKTARKGRLQGWNWKALEGETKSLWVDSMYPDQVHNCIICLTHKTSSSNY